MQSFIHSHLVTDYLVHVYEKLKVYFLLLRNLLENIFLKFYLFIFYFFLLENIYGSLSSRFWPSLHWFRQWIFLELQQWPGSILGIENASVIEPCPHGVCILQVSKQDSHLFCFNLLLLSLACSSLYCQPWPSFRSVYFSPQQLEGQLNCLFFNLSHIQLAYSFFWSNDELTDPFWFSVVGRNQLRALSSAWVPVPFIVR